MITVLVSLFAASFLITWIAVPFVERWARRHTLMDMPSERKIHREPTPRGGGLAVAMGLFFSILVAVAAVWLHRTYGLFDFLPASATIYAEGVMTKLPSLILILGGSLVMLILGLADDRRNLSPAFKLFIEILAAAGLVLGGERLSLFAGGSVPAQMTASVVTVLWIVAITNAFNLIDHVDGLATGTAAIVSTAFLVVAVQTGQWFLACLLVPLIGACAGFLRYNFPPARIFLGDTGSLMIGFFLGAMTLPFTFYTEHHDPMYVYLVPLAILSVPLFDIGAVTLRRWKQGRPIFQGDLNHFAHRLIRMGLTPRSAVLILYLLTLCSGLAAILLYQVNRVGAIMIFGQLVLIFGIITLLEWGTRRDS